MNNTHRQPVTGRFAGRCRRPAFRGFLWLGVWFALLVPAVESQRARAADDNRAVEQRLAASLKYLASDELEGRGVGTEGVDKAADFIAHQFAELGLETKSFDGTPFQHFQVTADSKLGPPEQNRLVLVGPPSETDGPPQRIELKLGEDFNTLAIGGSAAFDVPLVFAGYGVTAKDLKYDDYADIDVRGKAVLILRKEPQQDDPRSVFDGKRPSQHALFSRKTANAFEHGAAAVLIVNDAYSLQEQQQIQQQAWQTAVDKLVKSEGDFASNKTPSPEERTKHRQQINSLAKQIGEIGQRLEGDFDQVLGFQAAGIDSNRKLPVFFCSRDAVRPLLNTLGDGKNLESIESQIDADLKPRSGELTGWRASGESNVIHRRADVKNVIAVLPGEGPLAEETIVVGAHYDHLGKGGPGSLAPWTKDIHNGADDNASGSSALLEVARRFATSGKKPRRRIVFIAFAAEERGLLGSAKYVREPRFPLEKTVAMVNMDMVGRLSDNKLIVYGTGTATEFDPLIERLNETYQFQLTKKPSGYGPSDHASFYAQKIPVFHFFTGTHQDYHRPSDDFDKINFEGMRRIVDLVTDVVQVIADADQRPHFQARQASGREE